VDTKAQPAGKSRYERYALDASRVLTMLSADRLWDPSLHATRKALHRVRDSMCHQCGASTLEAAALFVPCVPGPLRIMCSAPCMDQFLLVHRHTLSL
jgi:hypothetical protein